MSPFDSSITPEQNKTLVAALQKHCERFGIIRGTPEYDATAELIMALFLEGKATTSDELAAALEADRQRFPD